MQTKLIVTIGQYSDRGRKDSNQDFHGAFISREPQLSSKGIALAISDGISSSDVSHIASESAVSGFLEDYFSTSESWSVKTSAEKVISAINAWLYAQTQQSRHRYEKDRGYVCTFTAAVLKSSTAHVFHIGDSRVFRFRQGQMEQMTDDHRVWVSADKSYLARALGMDSKVNIDYRTIDVEVGDYLVLSTDGVYEYVDTEFINSILLSADDLNVAAQRIVEDAYARGSHDNLTIQIVRVDQLPDAESGEIYRQISSLSLPPRLEARMHFEGYTIIREVRISSRSYIYLAVDDETGEQVMLKIPSIGMRDDSAYLERFLMEEWIARRVNNAHVLKPCSVNRVRKHIFVATEYIDGQTLSQWMIDHPNPEMDAVRNIIDQIAKGLRALHRLEMIHQDLKPENIMIDKNGTVKIIDFGATRVAGIMEMPTPIEQHNLLGSAQYAAPEYFLGESGTAQSDLFSLGVITYQMLCGHLPYGVDVPKCTTRKAQKRLVYRSLLVTRPSLPVWVDGAIHKCLMPHPDERYQEASEFIYDLYNPNASFMDRRRQPLLERDPLVFWKSLSLLLFLVVLFLLILVAK